MSSRVLLGRVISIRYPKLDEGDQFMAQIELLDDQGFRGTLSIPFDPKVMKLGSTFRIEVKLTPIPYNEFLDNYPRIAFSWHKRSDFGVV